MPDILANQKNRPDCKHSGYSDICADIKIVRDLASTKKMRIASTDYLFKQQRETDEKYNKRLGRTVLFPGYTQTVEALVGNVFKKEIVLGEDVPGPIRSQIEDIDLAGNHLDVFAKRLFKDQFEGCALVLVEHQPALPEGSTREDEVAANRRPYWVKYKHDQVVNYRKERVNGKQEFTLITVEEKHCVPDGEYGEKEVKRYRTFRKVNGVVSWELKELVQENKTDNPFIEIGRGLCQKPNKSSLSRIPVYEAGELCDPPPLLDLAYLNISHWNNVSDQENILNITRVPQLIRTGASEETKSAEAVAGVSGIWDLPPDATVQWLEIKADGATKAGRDNINDIQQRMGMVGLSTLTQRVDSDVTATEKKIDAGEKNSQLSTMARSLKDCLEGCLQMSAEYQGLDSGGSLELGVSEAELVLTPQHMQVLLAAVEKNKLPLSAFLHAALSLLDTAGVLAEDASVEDWEKKIEEATKVSQAVGLATGTNPSGLPGQLGAMFGAPSGNGATY